MIIRIPRALQARPVSRVPRHRSRRGWRQVVALVCCAGFLGVVTAPREANAAAVTLNTASLANVPGRFEFLLLDGDGVANNFVTISNIVSNGTFVGTDCSVGCTSGPSTFVIDDSLVLGQLFYDLILGTSLSFDLSYTTNYGGMLGTDPPDRFALSLLDPNTNFSLVSTNLTFPDDALLTIDLIGSGVVQTASVVSPDIGIRVGALAVPEPASLALVVVALLGLVRRRAMVALRSFTFG